MNPFVPDLILEQHALGISRGSLRAVTMFADVSGFTELTTRMVERGGREGAAAVAAALTHYFDPLVAAVYGQGGFVAGFAGDAFTALFPAHGSGDAAGRAMDAAFTMREMMRQQPIYRSPHGEFPFAFRVGLASGSVEWGIVAPHAPPCSFYFRGEAIDACAEAGQQAPPGSLGLHGSLATTPRARGGAIEPARHESSGPPAWTDDGPFCPAEVAAFPLEGEMRSVVRLFVSFDDAGDVAERLLSIQLLANAYGGYLPRFDFGDKGGNALILFGVPTTHEDQLDRALELGLELLAHGEPSGMRLGITEDVGYAGWNGGRDRRELTCMGPATILAARLMMKAPWGTAWCSQRVAAQADGRYLMASVDPVALKGLPDPVVPHELRGRRSAAARRAPGAMVGRRAERATLARRIQRLALHGEGGVLHVDGVAGSGKTMLLETSRLLAGRHGILWIDAPCDRTLRTPFNPFAGALRRWAGLTATGASARPALDDAIASLAGVLPASIAASLRELGPALAELAGIAPADRASDALDARTGRHRARARHESIVQAIVAFTLALARRAPAIVAIDDAHAMDRSSYQAAVSILRTVQELPLLLLLAARPDDDGSPWRLAVPNAVTVVELGPMSHEELWTLLTEEADEPVSEGLVDVLQEKSGGNPHVARLLMAHLKASGGLDRAIPGLVLAGTDATLPDGARPVLLARLDRLESRVRRVVLAAAVLGHAWDLELLAGCLDGEPDLAELVEVARREGVWAASGEGRFSFASLALQEAAYDMLPPARRAPLHRAAARVLSAIHGERPEIQGTLGRHWEEAGDPVAASSCFLRAARRAMAAFAIDDAEPLVRSYLRNAPSGTAEGVEAQLLLLRVLVLRGHLAEALAVGRRTRDDARALGLRREEAIALVLTGETLRYEGDPEEVIACVSAGLEILRELGDREAFHAWCELAHAHAACGRYDEARQLLGSAREAARLVGARYAEGSITSHLATFDMMQGRYDESEAGFAAALAIGREIDARSIVVNCLANLGNVHCARGRAMEALDAFEEAYAEISAARHTTPDQGPLLQMLGMLHLEIGDEEQARALFERDLVLARSLGRMNEEATAHHRLGELDRISGRLPEARRHHVQARALADHLVKHRRTRAIVLEGEALVHADSGEPETARRLLDEAVAIHAEIGNRAGEGIVRLRQAALERAHGSPLDASRRLAEAESILAEVGDHFEIAKAVVERGRLELVAGRDARPMLEEAERRAAQLHVGSAGPLGRELAVLRAEVSRSLSE